MRKDFLIKILSLLEDNSQISLNLFDCYGGCEIVHDLDNNVYYLDDDATEEKNNLKCQNISYKVYNLDKLLDDVVAGSLCDTDINSLSILEKKEILAKYEIKQQF